MIIQCEGCAAKYFLPDAKVPPRPKKVRCPQCQAVFTLMMQPQNVVAAAEESVVRSPAKSADTVPKRAADGEFVRSPAPKAEEKAPAPKAKTPEPEPAARSGSKKGRAAGDKDHARAKRLARVLVSDILCYNQAKRDQALVDGNLMAVLGDEIKKSWELYKDKVGADVAKSTNYFKEALNEILADGQKVF